MSAVDRPREVRPASVVTFLLVVVALPAVLVGIAVERFPALSPIDEHAHVDYLRRIDAREIPRVGDRIGAETLRDVSCRTIGGQPRGECGGPLIDLDGFDARGYQYEAQQPPVYYALTSLVRRVIGVVVDDYVDSARLTGIAWLAGGLGLLWWVLRRHFEASVTGAATLCAALAVAPLVLSQSYTVNNDATSIAIGSVVLLGYVSLADAKGWRPHVLAAAVAFVLVMTKPLAILPLGAATLALLLRSFARGDRWRARALVAVPGVAALATYELWALVRDARARVPYSVVVDALLAFKPDLTEFPRDSLARVLPVFFEAYGSGNGSVIAEAYILGIATTVGLIVVVSPAIVAAFGAASSRIRELELGVLAVAVAAPPLLVTQSYFTVHKAGGANPRYALALLPLMVCGAVPLFQQRTFRTVAAGATGMLVVATMIGVVTFDVAA